MKDIISEGISKSSISVENSVDMRYVGQSHELMLPFKDGYTEDFHKLHKKTYGYANTDYGIEVVNIRVMRALNGFLGALLSGFSLLLLFVPCWSRLRLAVPDSKS